MTAILAIVSTGCGSQKQNVEPTISGGTYQGSSQNRLASMAKYGDWRTLVTSGGTSTTTVAFFFVYSDYFSYHKNSPYLIL